MKDTAKVEILYHNRDIVVALVDGVVYVSGDNGVMNPIKIPVKSGSDYMSSETVKQMWIQDYRELEPNRSLRYTLPYKQFDKALEAAIPSTTKGYRTVWRILSGRYATELVEAHEAAYNYLHSRDMDILCEEMARLKEMWETVDEEKLCHLIKWVYVNTDVLDLPTIECLVYQEFGLILVGAKDV